MKDSSTPGGGKARGALQGLKVLEWAQFVAAPYCSKILADNGAEVIKVEEPGSGDESRRWGPFPGDDPHPERSALFLYLNANKKGVTLNLKSEAGRDIFRQLVQQADVLIEDNPPALVERLGLDYESLKQANPRLIMTSITPFGQTGPYRDYRCYYLNTFHGSGFGYLTPADAFDPQVLEREPIMLGGFLGEYYAGVHGSTGVMAAVYAQRMLGVGQHVDVSKQETQFIAQKIEMAACYNGEEVINRVSKTGSHSWGGLLPCKDGYVFMQGTQAHQVAAIFDLMGNPEWCKEPKFGPDQFHMHSFDMRPHVVSWVAEHTKEEIFHGGQRRGAPLGAVYTVGECMNTDQLKAREFFVEMEHPEAGKLKYPGSPFRFSSAVQTFRRPAPLLGQHNEEVYGGLGYSAAQLAELHRTGVI